jgi:hypothetical protein
MAITKNPSGLWLQVKFELIGISSGIWTRPALVPAFAVVALAVSLVLGCCRSFDVETVKRDKLARAWMHPWPGKYDWVEISQWKAVTDSRMSKAESLLAGTGFLQLTKAQANDLVEEAIQPQSVSGALYLLRGVDAVRGKYPQEVFVRSNGEVWVGGEAISQCPVPMERRAVVAWLEQPPREVYITFSVGK